MFRKTKCKIYARNISRQYFIFLFFFSLFSNIAVAQDLLDQERKSLRSSLYNFSHIEFDLDFYQLNADQDLLSQTGNGTLKINENNYLNMEYNISNTWLNNSNYVIPGDFSFSYIYNIYAKNYHKKGFQGISLKSKMKLPTGKKEYLTGGENWVFEQQIYLGWKLNNNLYIANKIRVNFSIGSLPETNKARPYIRNELTLGYESDKFWIASTADHRYTLDKYQLFLKLEIGVKLKRSNGFFSSITSRTFGDIFYKYYLNLGYYKTF